MILSKKYYGRKKIPIAIFIILILSIIFIGMCIDNTYPNWDWLVVIRINDFRVTFNFIKIKEINSNIMDFFYLIWGLSITLVLFLIELGNVYYYGVGLKEIVKLSLDKNMIVIAACIYMLLCPMAYLSNANRWDVTCVICVVCTFLTFSIIPLYIIYTTGERAIRKLLINTTLDKLARWKNGGKSAECHGLIDGLPIGGMIRHVNYDSVSERHFLIKTIVLMFEHEEEQKNVFCMLRGTVIEFSILMVWMETIIETIELNTSRKRQQAVYILRKIWEKVITKIENKKEVSIEIRQKIITIYTVEFLLPFVKMGTQEAANTFLALKNQMILAPMPFTLYILLYQQYLLTTQRNWKKNYCISEDILQKSKENLKKEAMLWDQKLAWKLWTNWIVLNDAGKNLGMTIFLEFSKDVKNISEGKMEKIQTRALKRYFWKIGGM